MASVARCGIGKMEQEIMSKALKFYGYSDDTFACDGPGIDVDSDNCATGDPIVMLVSSREGRLIVSGQYAPDGAGGWLIGVAPWDNPSHEDEPIPNWKISITRSDRDYSPLLIIVAPDDVRVELLKRNER